MTYFIVKVLITLQTVQKWIPIVSLLVHLSLLSPNDRESETRMNNLLEIWMNQQLISHTTQYVIDNQT